MYGGGNIYLDKDMEKTGSSDHFPKGTGCKSWFFRMSTALNWIAPLIIAPPIILK